VSLILQNPHSVLAALNSRPGDVTEVRFHADVATGHSAWKEVADVARANGVPVVFNASTQSGRRKSKQQHQKTRRPGIAEARVRECPESSPDEMFATADSSPDHYGLWLAFDQIQDPHNAGAIFRTAAFFGVRGIVMTKDRSVPLNATVYDIACGGLEGVPFTLQSNLARTLKVAKDAGLWVLGTSEHAEENAENIPLDRNWLLVLGNEEKGLRRLSLEHCDMTCALKPSGVVTSLNVSVAAGILIARFCGSP